MTPEQCIEVAEKVWMWHYKEAYEDKVWSEQPPPYRKEGSWFNGIDALQKEVNSWQGFGRTVEAMVSKGWQFVPWDDVCGTGRVGFMNSDQIFFPTIWDYSNPVAMIEEVHLAALEATKNES